MSKALAERRNEKREETGIGPFCFQFKKTCRREL
jgi:hypothetical protein